MKQLERFVGCLTYVSDFIKDLAKLRKLLQQILKKEVSWIWTHSDSKIAQNIKKMCKNIPVLNLPSKGDDLVLETDATKSTRVWC